MGLESVTTADDLVITNPVSGDPRSEGDDHLRNLKIAVKYVWANVWSTGDVKLTLKTTADTGWVLMNDTTIGNASSGATGRANADTVNLFTLLWNNTANADCAVSSGRGASAAADFAANKTIALPKALGRALACYGSGSGLTARAMAQILGEENHTLTVGETPVKSHSHGQQGSFTTSGHSNDHSHGIAASGYNIIPHNGVNNDHAAGTSGSFSVAPSGTGGVDTDHTHNVSISGNTAATQDTAASSHNTMQPTVFLNVMIKL